MRKSVVCLILGESKNEGGASTLLTLFLLTPMPGTDVSVDKSVDK